MDSRRSRRWWAPSLALVAAVSLTLSSCGASDSNGGTAKDVKVSDGGLTGDPIVVGSICSCTGPLAASLGRSADVLKAWGSWVNNHGGINGHPVKVVTYDDGQKPAKGLAAAKKLVEQDHVQAIVGQMSLTSASWASYVDSKGVPVVGGQPVDTTFFTDPNFYTSGTTLPLLLLAEVGAAKARAPRPWACLLLGDAPLRPASEDPRTAGSAGGAQGRVGQDLPERSELHRALPGVQGQEGRCDLRRCELRRGPAAGRLLCQAGLHAGQRRVEQHDAEELAL